ncbi:hypothetical protein AAGF08_12580, partial [Algoriphagus sp. SE2]|uniref:hypothetical protein n=1 Tax=Algoriphagus sp. SE2 TaxID=3141536 RepID=UPI0031CD53A7
MYTIPDDLTIIQVNKDALTTILLEEIAQNDTTHYLINSTGDTVRTGIPVQVQGKTVPTTQPQPKPALPARFKDDAIAGIQYLDREQGMNFSSVS